MAFCTNSTFLFRGFLCGKGLTHAGKYAIILGVTDLGVAQMVARYLGVVEVVGSNPVTPTNM